MVQLSVLNRISIAEICVYAPALIVAVILSTRHGFGRNAGWLYLILFSLVRILGSALALATLNDPRNIGLATGAATLQSIGLSPLILTMLGLLGRVLESIRHSRNTLLEPRWLRLVQTLVVVGLILGIVGGVKLGTDTSNAVSRASSTGVFVSPSPPTESRAGLALTIAGFGILVISTALCATQIRAAEPGEKRLLGAVAVALPFVFVRLIYSCVSTFAQNPDFRQIGGGPRFADYFLGMSVIMEMVAVAVLEGVGLTLRKIPKGERAGLGEAVAMGRVGRGGRRAGGYKAGGAPGHVEAQESGVTRG